MSTSWPVSSGLACWFDVLWWKSDMNYLLLLHYCLTTLNSRNLTTVYINTRRYVSLVTFSRSIEIWTRAYVLTRGESGRIQFPLEIIPVASGWPLPARWVSRCGSRWSSALEYRWLRTWSPRSRLQPCSGFLAPRWRMGQLWERMHVTLKATSIS